jgi:hypothetical protein
VPAVRRSRLLPALAAATLVLGVQLLGGLAVAAPNPPGNNGTVKVDDIPFDDHPDNEPHVGCIFQVDFYGYDEGDLFADVSFESHPPTGPVQVLLTDTVFIGEDDNAGGGSEAGLDASETYTLDFTGIAPHPNQGFHVMLTIHAEGSQGADTKYKVFWVTGCPSGTTTSTGATSSSGSTTSTTGGDGSTTTTTGGGGSSSSEPGSSVGGSSSSAAGGSAGGVSSTEAGAGLAGTGANTAALLGAGLSLFGLGTATLLAAARRRRA